MAENETRLTAKGKRNGKFVTVECIQQGEGRGIVKVLKNGKEDIETEIFLHGKIYDLSLLPNAGLPNYSLLSVFSYAMALYEYFFDGLPDIEITDGNENWKYPFIGEDTDGIVF